MVYLYDNKTDCTNTLVHTYIVTYIVSYVQSHLYMREKPKAYIVDMTAITSVALEMNDSVNLLNKCCLAIT